MLKIAVDFDETLFPTMERVLDIYNEKHDACIKSEQLTEYNLHDNLPHEIADELVELFVDRRVYDNLQPYKGAVRAIKSFIEQGHEIYIATSTDVQNMWWKEQLLNKYFPFIPKKNLIRIHNKSLLRVDVMIDDKLDNLTQTFAERVCFNQPWNYSESKDVAYSIYRAHHWGEIMNIINEIERKIREWEK